MVHPGSPDTRNLCLHTSIGQPLVEKDAAVTDRNRYQVSPGALTGLYEPSQVKGLIREGRKKWKE